MPTVPRGPDVRPHARESDPHAPRFRRAAVHRRRACRGGLGRRVRRVAARDPFRRARRVLPVLLPRSGSRVGRTRGRRAVAGRRPRPGGRRPRRRTPRRPASGSRSAFFCRRWTCTSTACRSSGRVTRVSFTRGRFLPAYHHDAAAVNERSEIWIDHGGQLIVARQIVGHPGAARRVPRRGRGGRARGRSLRHHEIRIADGRVPAAERDDHGRGRRHGARR